VPTDPRPTVVLLAGPSGSGKSRVTRLAGVPSVNLDDFYFDADTPGLPRTQGRVDWDDVGSWDAETAVAALAELSRTGSVEVPVYSIPTSRRVGHRRLELGQAGAFLAEGLFAPDLVSPCQRLGLKVAALYLDRPRTVSLVLRFLRDVRESRKPLPVLVRRGLALWRGEPVLRRHALARGCRPMSQRRALNLIRAAAVGASLSISSGHSRS